MDKKIYKILNEVVMDLDSYENENNYENESVSELKIKKIQRYVKKYSRRSAGRNKIGAAVVASLFIITGVMFSNEVYAFVEQIGYKISDTWNLKNIDRYVNVVNTSQWDNGYTITLNEVILDYDELIICQTITGDEKLPGILLSTGSLMIDGRRIDTGGFTSGTSLSDGYFYEEILNYIISDSPLSANDNHEIQYSISEIEVLTGQESKVIKGDWLFRFTITGDELKKDTVFVDIGDKVTVSDKYTIVFEQFTANVVNEKIYYYWENYEDYEEFCYDIELRGYDDLGNQVVFCMNYFENGRGVIRTENVSLNEDAKRLILYLYVLDGSVENEDQYFVDENGNYVYDYKQVGQEITIDIIK